MLGSCEDGSVVLHPFAERTLQTPRTVVREAERVHDVSWYPWMDAQGTRQGPIRDGFNCGGQCRDQLAFWPPSRTSRSICGTWTAEG